LIAMITPVCRAIETFVAALDQTSGVAGHAPPVHSISGAALSSVRLFPWSTNRAAAVFGFGFGTAIGSEFALDVSCIRHARACALILGTKPPNRNHGRCVSVPLTSSPWAPLQKLFGGLEAQGEPPVLSPAPESP